MCNSDNNVFSAESNQMKRSNVKLCYLDVTNAFLYCSLWQLIQYNLWHSCTNPAWGVFRATDFWPCFHTCQQSQRAGRRGGDWWGWASGVISITIVSNNEARHQRTKKLLGHEIISSIAVDKGWHWFPSAQHWSPGSNTTHTNTDTHAHDCFRVCAFNADTAQSQQNRSLSLSLSVCMYIYIYIYNIDRSICACVHACTHACMYACTSMYECVYAHIHACIRAWVHACMHTCTHVCMHVCVYVNMVACMCTCKCVCV